LKEVNRSVIGIDKLMHEDVVRMHRVIILRSFD
jgi:hypothetical protein